MPASNDRFLQFRDQHHPDRPIPFAAPGNALAVRIAIGALLGLLLAIVAGLTAESEPVERLTLPHEAPPEIAVDER